MSQHRFDYVKEQKRAEVLSFLETKVQNLKL